MRAAADAAQASGVQTDPLALPHTDWLRHELTVSGPADDVAAFSAASAGAGVIPWDYPDLDQWEEDRMHALLRPPDDSAGLPMASARALARALRAAMADHHARAVAQVGQSRACPLDLHALLPVPNSVLRLGPDDPASRNWLRRHWGTVEPLRHVSQRIVAPDRRRRRTARLDFEFWSADWTPWTALAAIRRQWPRLVLDIHPDYGSV